MKNMALLHFTCVTTGNEEFVETSKSNHYLSCQYFSGFVAIASFKDFSASISK